MCKLLEDNPEMRIFPKDCHPNKKAHKYWAECLLEYINDKKV
jgi:phospholipase/lecithinase/hemolysin